MTEIVRVDVHDDEALQAWYAVEAASIAYDRPYGSHRTFAALAVVTRDHPERTTLHTWTDPANTAMQRTNAAFGYRPVERMYEVQRKD